MAAVVAFVVLSFASDVFATQQNLFNVTRNFAFVAIIAIGMTAVIISGGIDLSVGAVLVLSGMVIGMTMNAGMSIWLRGAAGARRVAAGGCDQRRDDRLRRRAAVRGDAGHAVDRAQPGDGAVGQPHGLPVRPRPAEAAGARRRLRRPAAAAARCDPHPEPGAVSAGAAGDHRVRVPLHALGPPRVRDRRQRGRRHADRCAGQAHQGQRLHVLQPRAPASPASSRWDGSAPSPPASGRAWS